METMNLNDTNDGMVPLYPKAPPPPPPPQAPAQGPPPMSSEKNIPKQQITMDSTPIADIMQDLPDAQDPRAQFMMPPQVPMVQQAAMPMQKQQAAGASKHPFGLTDEQYNALIAGVAAVIAFSQPVQTKLSTTIPQFLTEAGSRSTTGLIATGLIAAIVFYLAQRFLNK
jgi:hypothetical protein